MLTGPETQVATRRDCCAVCAGHQLDLAIDLPNLPLTGLFAAQPMRAPVQGIDQQLLVCRQCGHPQAAMRISPALLYGNTYQFRTSVSATARSGTAFFLSALQEVAGDRRFRCALDLGCNDLYLLRQLGDRAELRVGIDPIWAGQAAPPADEGIGVIGAPIEAVDLRSALPDRPDLIVCRHTLEHIDEPRLVLQQLLDVAADNALLLFEVPAFEPLFARLRFDQVFHQHLQYFTLPSFRRLLTGVGGQYLGHWQNYHDWGALLVAFQKAGGHTAADPGGGPTVSAIRSRYELFKRHMSVTGGVLASLGETTVYGYGAAQMLPVLAYHLGTDLGFLQAVLDDDPAKQGAHYWNLPLVIRSAAEAVDLAAASVVITAVDHAAAIWRKLADHRPRHTLLPIPIV